MATPYCFCPRPCTLKVVTKDSENKGRRFWACATSRCNCFIWFEGESVPNNNIKRDNGDLIKPPWIERLDMIENASKAMTMEIERMCEQLKKFDDHVTYLQREMEMMTERINKMNPFPSDPGFFSSEGKSEGNPVVLAKKKFQTN